MEKKLESRVKNVRGFTRSGHRYARQNLAYYSSLAELKAHHKKLFEEELAVSTRLAKVLNTRHLLTQTTIRTPFNHPTIKENLGEVFPRLFDQHSEDSGFSGFEVVITFNAILANKDQTSFSVFYGADFRVNNQGGAAENFRHECKLRFSERKTLTKAKN